MDGDGQALEATFAQHDCAYWQHKLMAADIRCHPVIGIKEIRA